MKIKKSVCGVIAAVLALLAGTICVSAKTVVKDMLPEKEWSSEGTLNPIKTEDGWKLKSSPTMDGGSAVTYFDMTYHKGQMIAYDFTVSGGDDANITIYIGFVRELDAGVYPNGKEGYHFTRYLAESIGIEPTGPDGEEKATIPGGTYKGVLDPGDFFYDGFDKFQHVAFYVGGEEAVIREFAFVDGASAGAEVYPKPAESKPNTPSSVASEDTPSDKPEHNNSDRNDVTEPKTEETEKTPSGYTAVLIAAGAVTAVSLGAAVVMAVILIKNKKRKNEKG